MCLSDCFVWVLTALSRTSFFRNFDKRISSECIHDQLYGDIVACAGQATDRCSFAICISALWSFKLTIYYYVTIVHIVCSPNETNNLCQVLLLHLLSVFDASEVSFGSFRFFFPNILVYAIELQFLLHYFACSSCMGGSLVCIRMTFTRHFRSIMTHFNLKEMMSWSENAWSMHKHTFLMTNIQKFDVDAFNSDERAKKAHTHIMLT